MTGEIRVLFVDDEPHVLSGIQRMLRPMRGRWNVEVSSSGFDALALLAARPFDVVVSDMRMPQMTGGELLREIQRLYPAIVRIALSGQSDERTVLGAIGPIHQFLSKPCDAATLKSSIERAVAMRGVLRNASLAALVSRLETLPSMPALYSELETELRKHQPSLAAVGQVIARDIGMSAKVLQLVNSGFYCPGHPVVSAQAAANLLGLETIRSLMLTARVFAAFDAGPDAPVSAERVWLHSAEAAGCVKLICEIEQAPGDIRDVALMAALLHDAGKLVLAQSFPEEYRAVEAMVAAGETSEAAEASLFAVNHAEIGAYLFGLWGLPPTLVDAVHYHHSRPERVTAGLTPELAIHVGDTLVRRTCATRAEPAADLSWLSEAGLSDSMDRWTTAWQERRNTR